MTKTWMSGPARTARPTSVLLLQIAAATLQAASLRLARMASARSLARARADTVPPIETVEFHALYGEAGAPEGALYVNGQLVARLPGVTRL